MCTHSHIDVHTHTHTNTHIDLHLVKNHLLKINAWASISINMIYSDRIILDYVCIPYSEKVWRVESLANLVNCLQFAKLK